MSSIDTSLLKMTRERPRERYLNFQLLEERPKAGRVRGNSFSPKTCHNQHLRIYIEIGDGGFGRRCGLFKTRICTPNIKNAWGSGGQVLINTGFARASSTAALLMYLCALLYYLRGAQHGEVCKRRTSRWLPVKPRIQDKDYHLSLLRLSGMRTYSGTAHYYMPAFLCSVSTFTCES